MKIKLPVILSLFIVLVLNTSCHPDDFSNLLKDWKNKNDSYFTSMKDSTGYTEYTIPASRGGGSFYYKVITTGDSTSVSPLINEMVAVDYRGKLVDGTVFDQNYTGATVPPDSLATPTTLYPYLLINGFAENLTQMKVGETRNFVLPQELGYGSIGAKSAVGPYSTTIWTVRLIKVYHTN